MKSIKDYLPKKEKKVFIQGRIPESLYLELKDRLAEMGLSWNQYLEAVGKRFTDELKTKKN